MHMFKKIKFNCIRTKFAIFLLIRESRESQVFFIYKFYFSLSKVIVKKCYFNILKDGIIYNIYYIIYNTYIISHF